MTERGRAEIFIETLAQMLEVERTRRLVKSRRDETSHDQFSNWLNGGVDRRNQSTGPAQRGAHVDRSPVGQLHYR